MKYESLKKVLGLGKKKSMVSDFAFSNKCLVSIHPSVFTVSESSTENKGLDNKQVKR